MAATFENARRILATTMQMTNDTITDRCNFRKQFSTATAKAISHGSDDDVTHESDANVPQNFLSTIKQQEYFDTEQLWV